MNERPFVLYLLACLMSFGFCSLGSSLAHGEHLTVKKLKNTEYQTDYGKVTLRNGYYENRSERIRVWLSGKIAFGDLNGDGTEDAAVILMSSGGGSGTFCELVAVINRNGIPKQADSTFLGDRVHPGCLSIRSRQIIVAMTKHAPNDPMCCPSLRVTERFRLQGELLMPFH